MIGVSANPADLEVAREFFELFKTPWEPAVPGRTYTALLTTEGLVNEFDAKVVLVYTSKTMPVSTPPMFERLDADSMLWRGRTIPLYGRLGVCAGEDVANMPTADGKPVAYGRHLGSKHVWHIGYDLFSEVRHLLTVGQPTAHAGTPTLDLHVDLLRSLLIESGVTFLEVLPRPSDVDFVCCLTHDVDFVGIRRHMFDRTLAGFAWRATVGSVRDVLRRRKTLFDALRNWRSLGSLPFVFLGWAKDPWRPFDDYAQVEDRRQSTFFVVPFSDHPGLGPDGHVDARRAVRYRLADLREELQEARRGGSEVGVHGLDAWRDSVAGCAEIAQVRAQTGQGGAGIRMHWLYFSPESPRILETAGFDYDSTWGYNETVGYRAGTSQVFRLLASDDLLELPLSIMDSALFSDGRLGLTDREAQHLCDEIITHATTHGGTLVLNWHGRSLAPERLWGRFYRRLRDRICAAGRVWFATGAEAVEWFRWRRGIQFQRAGTTNDECRVFAAGALNRAGLIRIHRPGATPPVEDRVFDGRESVTLRLDHPRLIFEAS